MPRKAFTDENGAVLSTLMYQQRMPLSKYSLFECWRLETSNVTLLATRDKIRHYYKFLLKREMDYQYSALLAY